MIALCEKISNEGILYQPLSYGQSADALRVWEDLKGIVSDFLQPFNVINRLDKLEEAIGASSSDNWDGYGAKAFNPISYKKAEVFYQMLPTSIPVSDVTVDPDGMIEFEWYRGPRKVFTVTIEPDDKIIYAGLFGPNRICGTEHFCDEIPKVVFNNLQRLLTS